MATTKIRGNTQIIAGTITNTEISASAAIATTKLADGSLFLKSDGTVALGADLPAGGFKITGLGTPTSGTDAATKAYVDSVSTGLDVKGSVRAATTANIALTGTQTIDGVALSAGNRVLVKDQTTGADNGIYIVAGGAWTRATDADSSTEVTPGMFTFVEEGTVNGDSGWVLSTDSTITLGSTTLVFSQFTSAGAVSGGAGLLKTGTTLDIVAADASITVNADSIAVAKDAAGAITVSGTGIKVNTDGTTLTIASNALKIVDGGVGPTQLAASVVSATGAITGGAGTALSVAVGSATGLQISSNTLGIKVNGTTLNLSSSGVKVADAGITETQLATSVAGNGLAGGAGTALSVNVASAGGLEISSDNVQVKIDTAETVKSIATSATGTKINTSKFIVRETPSGTINGSNTAFTLAGTPVSGKEEVYLNGLLQEPGGEDYTISGTTITFVSAPVSGDRIRVSYITA